MKNQDNEVINIIGFGMVAALLIVVVLLAFMQSSIEKLEDKVKVIQYRIDSIEVIQSYPYNHSQIDNNEQVK